MSSHIKKIFALVLVLVQIFSLTATALEAPDSDSANARNEAENAFVSSQSERSSDWNALIDANEATYWSPSNPNGNFAEFSFKNPTALNTVILKEKTKEELVKRFHIEAFVNSKWKTIYKADDMGDYRFCTFKPVKAEKIRLVIDEAYGNFSISEFEMYNIAPKKLDKPFKVAAYKRLDSNKTYYKTERLAKLKDRYGVDSPEYKALYNELKTYSRYFEVVDEVILFECVEWTKNGNVIFSDGKDDFAREMKAIREVLEMRDIKKDIRFTLTVLNPKNDKDARRAIDWNCSRIARQIVNICKEFGIEGVDFDWEYPQSFGEVFAYERLIRTTKNQLKSRIGSHATVTVATSRWGNSFGSLSRGHIDNLNVMGYDSYDKLGRHSTFSTGAYKQIKAFREQKYSDRQIVLGIPFYGRPINGDRDWAPWKHFETNDQYWTNFIPVNKNTHPDIEVKKDIYLNSPAMIADKVAYAVNCGIGGIMLFHIDCDVPMDDPNSLTLAVENTLKERVADYRK